MTIRTETGRPSTGQARALGVVAALTLLVAGCTQRLNMDGVREAIKKGLADQVGLPLAGLSCPDSRDTKAGDTFECKAETSGGGTIYVQVTQKDEQGNVDWKVSRSEGLLSLVALQSQIIEGLKTQASLDATVSCGTDKYRHAKAGEVFDCIAESGGAEVGKVTVTVKDEAGNVSWSYVAAAAPGDGAAAAPEGGEGEPAPDAGADEHD